MTVWLVSFSLPVFFVDSLPIKRRLLIPICVAPALTFMMLVYLYIYSVGGSKEVRAGKDCLSRYLNYLSDIGQTEGRSMFC